MTTPIQDTHKLLLLCANPFCRTEDALPLLSKSINWDEFTDLAHQHRLLPIIHRLAAEWPRIGIPDTLFQKAEQAYISNTIRVEFLSNKLHEISFLFANQNIRAVPWKGPSLAQKVYPDPYLRPMDDLDFLVHPDHMMKAITALSAAGFLPRYQMSSAAFNRYIKAGCEYICSSPEKDLWIELAPRPLPPLFSVNGDTRTLWSSNSPSLTDELHFHFLCIHGARHCWERLIWISDLCAFLHSCPDLDLVVVAELAKSSHTEKMIAAALALVEATGFELKTRAFDYSGINIDRLISQVIAPVSTSALSELNRRIQFYSRKTDRFVHLFKWIAAPTYSDWQSINLPQSLSFLYWLIRPFRIAASVVTRKSKHPS